MRFLSVEPLLEGLGPLKLGGIDWVIVGGESGLDARPMNLSWARGLVEQCKVASVPCFVKQLGACPTVTAYHGHPAMPIEQPYTSWGEQTGGITTRAGFKDKKGGNPDEWPAELRVREFPR